MIHKKKTKKRRKGEKKGRKWKGKERKREGYLVRKSIKRDDKSSVGGSVGQFFFKVREVCQELGLTPEFLVNGDLKKKSSHGTTYPRVFFDGKDVPPQSPHNPPSYPQNSQYPPSYSTLTPEYPHTSHTHIPINVHFPPSTFRNFA